MPLKLNVRPLMTKPPPTLEAYLNERLVPREPEVPELNAADVRSIGSAVFVGCDPAPSDLMFVFGSANGDWEFVANLFHQGVAPTVLVTGRAGEDYYATGVPQAHSIAQALQRLGVPEAALIVEDGSDNTLENAVYGKIVAEQAGIHPASISLVCKSHHSGRAWRTLAAVFPKVELRCQSYDATYEGVIVRRENWPLHQVSRGRVYGEFKRIELYASRGEISSSGPPAA